MKIIKNLKGHSGSIVNLVKIKNQYYVHKSNIKNVKKIIDIYKILKQKNLKLANIIDHGDNFILMEYINGIDIYNLLSNEGKDSIKKIIEYINFYFENIITEDNYDFSNEIKSKLNHIYKTNQYLEEIISYDKLFENIPKIIPKSIIHGDFTFDNIIYKEGNFFLIDINPTNLNSIFFDLSKLLQDIDCYWFMRKKVNILNIKLLCQQISYHLKNKYDFLNNKYILIFMLMRIVPYCKDQHSKNFLNKNINKLCQL